VRTPSFSAVVSIVFVASACAVAATPESDTGNAPGSADAGASHDSGGKDAAKTPQNTPDSSTSSGDDASSGDTDSGVVDDSFCAAYPDKSSCQQCCLKHHSQGYSVYSQTLLACACTSPGACSTECASEYCANNPPTTNDACAQCLTSARRLLQRGRQRVPGRQRLHRLVPDVHPAVREQAVNHNRAISFFANE